MSLTAVLKSHLHLFQSQIEIQIFQIQNMKHFNCRYSIILSHRHLSKISGNILSETGKLNVKSRHSKYCMWGPCALLCMFFEERKHAICIFEAFLSRTDSKACCIPMWLDCDVIWCNWFQFGLYEGGKSNSIKPEVQIIVFALIIGGCFIRFQLLVFNVKQQCKPLCYYLKIQYPLLSCIGSSTAFFIPIKRSTQLSNESFNRIYN